MDKLEFTDWSQVVCGEIKNEDNPKTEDNHKNKYDLIGEDNLKIEWDIIIFKLGSSFQDN